ncbi:hypothetical protein IJ114_03540 [Candidatus Saccharibacteria bacterium]|nr:hypothetical protein [Candidatus Saccharibacteria bacterium]MBQ9029809.1 hypothetical protein [Candidatus Saccharibacteria bacterium]
MNYCKMTKQEWQLILDTYGTGAKIWKSAVEEFPDEGLRKYFAEWENFYEFYDKMNRIFHNEEVRFLGLFDIWCPELKSIASNTSRKTEYAIEHWSIKVGWI